MTKRFLDRTESILLASGWHEGRTVNVDGIEAEISTRFRLTMFPVVRQFLTEFSGICLAVPRGVEVTCFNVFDAIRGADILEDELRDAEAFARLCCLTKGSVYPVGAQSSDICILMRGDGVVFSLDDPPHWLSFWGRMGDEAIEHACAPVRALTGIAIEGDLTMEQVPGDDVDKVLRQW